MAECCECQFWHGLKEYGEWGDCSRILFSIVPDIADCHSDFGYVIQCPFDPHDVIYFRNNNKFRKLWRKANSIKEDGVRSVRDGPYKFLQTRRNFSCGGSPCKL